MAFYNEDIIYTFLQTYIKLLFLYRIIYIDALLMCALIYVIEALFFFDRFYYS